MALCARCGQRFEYVSNTKRRKYCSEACRVAAGRREGVIGPDEPRLCACGAETWHRMSPYCSACRRSRDREREARHRARRMARAGRYGEAHRAERRAWRVAVERGDVLCCRCGERISARADWDLDHRDSSDGYLGPAHAVCNRRAGGLAAHGAAA